MTKHHTPEHVFEEKGRIGKLSQIREIVFGTQDGLLVPLGVVSSVAGAFSNNHIVLVAGISEALAGAFSMATGAYLASQAEDQVYKYEIKKERAAFAKFPDDEKEEMVMLYEKDGFSREEAKRLVDLLFGNEKVFFETMVHKELGLDPEPPGSAMNDAIYVGLSYLIAAFVPILPYFFISGTQAILLSMFLTLVALFGIGLVKAKFAALNYLKAGLQVLLIGSVSGIGGYLLGVVLPHILGIK